MTGRIRCQLCHATISASDEVLDLPPDLFDSQSTLSHLNGSRIHGACVRELPDTSLAHWHLNDFLSGREAGQRLRPFTAIVASATAVTEERVSMLATSRYEAVALLRATYGDDCWFDLTDVEPATRLRECRGL